jgi:hypothetical protein
MNYPAASYGVSIADTPSLKRSKLRGMNPVEIHGFCPQRNSGCSTPLNQDLEEKPKQDNKSVTPPTPKGKDYRPHDLERHLEDECVLINCEFWNWGIPN